MSSCNWIKWRIKEPKSKCTLDLLARAATLQQRSLNQLPGDKYLSLTQDTEILPFPRQSRRLSVLP